MYICKKNLLTGKVLRCFIPTNLAKYRQKCDFFFINMLKIYNVLSLYVTFWWYRQPPYQITEDLMGYGHYCKRVNNQSKFCTDWYYYIHSTQIAQYIIFKLSCTDYCSLLHIWWDTNSGIYYYLKVAICSQSMWKCWTFTCTRLRVL